MKTRHAVCVNADPILVGESALIKDHPSDVDRVLAQFDNTDLVYTLPNGQAVLLGYDWHDFHKDAFQYDEEQEENE